MKALILALAALGLAIAARAATPAGVNTAAIAHGLPATLAEFALFADSRRQIPAEGVLPYRINTPLYSDGADKLRFVYLPDGAKLTVGEDGLLQFPVGTALVKTFAFGEGEGRRLIETRLLLHRAEGWVALPYQWNQAQTEARLALAGARVPVTTPAGEAISYRIPNKNQCKECHGLNGAVIPLGPKARNLDKSWLDALVASGRLAGVPAGSDVFPEWERREQAPAEAAARAYLDVNCAHCHRPGAMASNSGLDLRWEQSNPTALGIGKRPVAAGRGSGGLLFGIVPGHPEQSIMVHRMASTEGGVAMPELGKATVDRDGLAVVEKWIAGMPR